MENGWESRHFWVYLGFCCAAWGKWGFAAMRFPLDDLREF